MNLAEVRELFHKLCVQHNIEPQKIILKHGVSKVREARALIIKAMYEAGAKTWQIKEIIPRDDSTLWHARKKVM